MRLAKAKKSILMIGQSNMAGRGFIDDVPVICNEKILMLRNGRWETMVEPINYDRPIAGVGLASSFAALWSMYNKGEEICLIPCAEGGSSIEEWDVNNTLFEHAVSEAKFAMKNSELIGIIWHHGESDCFFGKHTTYAEKLKKIVDALRKELDAPDIPFICGAVGDYLGKSAFGAYCTEYEEINEAMKKFVEENDECYFVTAEGLTANPDGIHMDAKSLRIFGVRYYEAFSKRMNIFEPVKKEQELLQKIYDREMTDAEKNHIKLQKFITGKMSFDEYIGL